MFSSKPFPSPFHGAGARTGQRKELCLVKRATGFFCGPNGVSAACLTAGYLSSQELIKYVPSTDAVST